MKNKKMTYLLIIAVAAVWGIILYRLLDATGNNEEALPAPTASLVKEPYNDFAVTEDTTKLLLNYRDPFGVTPFKDTTAVMNKNSQKHIVVIKPAVSLDWHFIQYAGYIKNPVSKKLVALLTINGKNEMLSEGETKQQVKLLRNLRDSIKVVFAGKTKFITIKSGAL